MNIEGKTYCCPCCHNIAIGKQSWSPNFLKYNEEYFCPNCNQTFVVRYERVRVDIIND